MSDFKKDRGKRNTRVPKERDRRASQRPVGTYPSENSTANSMPGEYIEGRNAVLEALRAGRPLNKLFVAKGEVDNSLRMIVAMAKESGAVVVETDRRKLDAMSETHSHQGVIADVAVKEYCTVQDILDIAEKRGEPPFIVICDEISDAHNLGAVIRTSEAAGVHGIIIPKRRSAGLSAVVSKTSAGAIEYMAVARVANLPSAIQELKDYGVWVYGTAADGDSDIWHTDLTGPIAIVIGSEGEGMRRLVAENCDVCVSIPMEGNISSLNASASAAIVIYEALRQKSLKK